MNKFLVEILEQPESINATLSYYLSNAGKARLKELQGLLHKGEFQRMLITGMGSSYFASYAASSLFNRLGFHTCAMNTSELLHYHFPVITERTVLVCVSQSGESYEVVKLLEKLPEEVMCVGVTNEEKSTLTSKTKGVLLTQAGKEEMTSTKTYTATTLVMFILGWYLAGVWGDEKVQQIRKLMSGVQETLTERKSLIGKMLDFFGEIHFMQFIGRGPTYSTALQSELMFKEAARIAAAGSFGGEFRHGPMEMVRPGFKSVLFAAEGKTYNQSMKMAADIAGYQGKAVVITNKNIRDASDKNMMVIAMDQPDEYLFSIQSIIPVQLLVNDLALSNGYEPGRFVHGGKVTLAE